MAKFVLIDPSIVDFAGHYYEYAVRVLKAASNRGFETVLATNRRFRCEDAAADNLLPVYRYAYFEPALPRFLRRVVNRAAAADSIGRQWPGELATHARRRSSFKPLAAAWRRTQSSRKRRAFATESYRLFRRLSIDRGDHVFMPTVAEADLLGLIDVFDLSEATKKATWHLVFRRDVTVGLHRALARFTQFHGTRCVRFYTDTKPLSEQYNQLGVANFETLPIPHDPVPWSAAIHGRFHTSRSDFLSSLPDGMVGSSATRKSGDESPHSKVHVVYLGDARTEKGYHHLPQLVLDAVAAELPVRFTIQSNFNVSGGEPAARQARGELESLSRHYDIKLLYQPLTSREYRELLVDADVVVLPYDREAYWSRSSGVFAEALTAGKPVVVPEGTWMASELTRAPESGVAYANAAGLFTRLAELVIHYDRYRAGAGYYADCLSRWNPAQELVDLLMDLRPD